MSDTEIRRLELKNDGCCNGAYKLREGNNLATKCIKFTPSGLYGVVMRFTCPNKSCVFSATAIKNEKGRWTIDNKVCHQRVWVHKLHDYLELQFRILFLAKCHVRNVNKPDGEKFKCIICILRGDRSETYHSMYQLLEHVVQHWGDCLNGVKLLGPLSFTNEGVKTDGEFDLFMPKVVIQIEETKLNQAKLRGFITRSGSDLGEFSG